MENFTRQQIKDTLVEGYFPEYDEYKRWEDAAKALGREDDEDGYKAAKRMANNYSHRLEGYKAAEALGISVEEFLTAVSRGKPER